TRFAPLPLDVAELKIPSGDVVERGVAEHVVIGAIGGDARRLTPDDDGELRLVVQLLARRRNDARLAWSDDATGEFREERGRFRNGEAALAGMVVIVHPDAHDLAGPRNGREPVRRLGRHEPPLRTRVRKRGWIALQTSGCLARGSEPTSIHVEP